MYHTPLPRFAAYHLRVKFFFHMHVNIYIFMHYFGLYYALLTYLDTVSVTLLTGRLDTDFALLEGRSTY